jgi:serine/threonine-protein kinase
MTGVPDVRRKTVSEAEALLKEANLKLRISRRIASETYRQDEVIQTDPAPGTKVYEGNTINAEVSAGSRFVEVPDLRGLSQDEARLLLDSVGLKLDTRVEEKRDPDVKKGTVLQQIPEPRKRVERRTEIKVVVSSGRERPDRTGSQSTERFLYTLRIELSDITETVMMRVDMTDARGTRPISEPVRRPGVVVELSAEGVGEKAIFLIYYDGELITQETKFARPPENEEEAQQP